MDFYFGLSFVRQHQRLTSRREFDASDSLLDAVEVDGDDLHGGDEQQRYRRRVVVEDVQDVGAVLCDEEHADRAEDESGEDC